MAKVMPPRSLSQMRRLAVEAGLPLDEISGYVLWVLRQDPPIADPPSLGEWREAMATRHCFLTDCLGKVIACFYCTAPAVKVVTWRTVHTRSGDLTPKDIDYPVCERHSYGYEGRAV